MDINQLQKEIETRRKGWHSNYDRSDCITAVERVSERVDATLTQKRYDANKSTDQPASGTIRDRLDMSWAEIRDRYAQP